MKSKGSANFSVHSSAKLIGKSVQISGEISSKDAFLRFSEKATNLKESSTYFDMIQ